MSGKRLSYGFLAAVLLLGSIAWPAPAVEAAEPDLERGLTAYYSFDEESLDNSAGEKKGASAIVTGLGAYTEDVTWKDGKSEKAIQLGSYGLQLNQKNLGDNFTVSMWLKPDGALDENQSVLFLGYHNPEKWVGVAGNVNSSAECKVWANGEGYAWETFDTVNLPSGTWHCLTMTGTGDTLTAYLDGEQVASGATNHPLVGENQDIYVGVNNWDKPFTGLVDEVRVYDRTLTEGELYQLYDNRAPEVILEEKGIIVTPALQMPVKRNESIQIQMPAVVREYGAVISCESSDSTVASVDSSGKVRALKEGTADITVSVTLNGVTKTAVTSVTVAGTIEDSLAAYYKFDKDLDDDKSSTAATALQKGLGMYSGVVQYEDGRDGQAVSLKNYGLKLNHANLGKEYTVSLWLKPTQNLAENQIMLFLGHHDPELWTAVSGDTSGVYKIWANGGAYGAHTTLFSPEVTANEWHQLTLTGTAGTVSVWLDGISLGTDKSNDPLNGSDQDIYLGVNNWDAEFDGLIDEVRIYSIALNEEEVQNQAPDDFHDMLQKKMESRISSETILGANESTDEIKYDLTLPFSMSGLPVVWKSSNPEVVADDGTVINPSSATEVTLTATITTGNISASVICKLKVAPLDRSILDRLIEKAESIDTKNLVEASRERLAKAIEEAKAADSYSKVAAACERLAMASSKLCYMDDFQDPFPLIGSPAVRTSVKEGGSENLFSVPGSVEDAVDISYFSEKPEIVRYSDGTITGLKSGKAVVTAVVTSKYDQWVMECSTAVSVEEKGSDPDDSGDPSNPGGSDDSGDPSNPGGPDDSGDPSNPGGPTIPDDPTDPNHPSNPWNPTTSDDSSSSDGKRTKRHSSGNAASQVEPAKNADTGDSTDLVLPVAGLFTGVVLAAGYGRRRRKIKL